MFRQKIPFKACWSKMSNNFDRKLVSVNSDDYSLKGSSYAKQLRLSFYREIFYRKSAPVRKISENLGPNNPKIGTYKKIGSAPLGK